MNIDVIISADYIEDNLLDGKVAVVIDVLRATSVMVTALGNGASFIVPTLTADDAFEEKIKYSDNVLLAGERQAKIIEGFDFSNSPLELRKEVVDGKVIVMSTTNGTRALTLSKKAEKILIASNLNARAIAKQLVSLNKDVVIINAGTNGEFSIDDFICGGYIISEIEKCTSCALTDISKVAKDIYEANSDIKSYVTKAKHFGVLKSLNLEGDIEHCMKKDVYDFAVEFKDGKILKM